MQRELSELFPADVAGGLKPNQSLYFTTPLPTLPPGDYEVTAEVRTAEDDRAADKEIDAPEFNDELNAQVTTPDIEGTLTVNGELTVPSTDVDPTALKRLAVLAIVTKPAENEDFQLQTSSPTEVDLSELISRSGQAGRRRQNGPPTRSKARLYLDELRRAGKKWAMCAHLDHQNRRCKNSRCTSSRKTGPIPIPWPCLQSPPNATPTESWAARMRRCTRSTRQNLKLALEAATGLKLTPPGLFLTYEHTDEVPPRTVVHRSEIHPEMFRSETDFVRIDEWLRNVYLADSEIPAVPETSG